MLESAAANKLGLVGEGRPSPYYIKNGSITQAICEWGSPGGPGMAAEARIVIYAVPRGVDVWWQTMSVRRGTDVPDLGDEAFSVEDPASAAVYVRSRNAAVTVRVIVPTELDAGWEVMQERVHDIEPAARVIARDVVDDLR